MWKPRPVGGPPSPWIDTTAFGWTELASAARSSTHGPGPVSSPRDIAVRTPSAVSAWRTRSVVSQLKVCSGYPSLVEVPLAWQSLVPPRPVGTCLLIEASLVPLWPGSRNTIFPARVAGAAWAGPANIDAATSVTAAIAEAVRTPTRWRAGRCTATR